MLGVALCFQLTDEPLPLDSEVDPDAIAVEPEAEVVEPEAEVVEPEARKVEQEESEQTELVPPSEPQSFWDVPVDDDTSDFPRPRKAKRKLRAYRHVALARMTLGLGFPRKSEHEELLAKDGYHLGTRTYLELAADAVLGRHLALGPYVGFGFRRSEPTQGAPPLRETIWRFGGEIAWVAQPSGNILLTLGPQLGVVRGTLGVHGEPDAQTVFEYGAFAAGLWRVSAAAPIWYWGATLGYTVAHADPPTKIGREYDYGALYLALVGALGG